MANRADVIDIHIPVCSFQDFDHGSAVEVVISEELDVQIGDRVTWFCAQFDGHAEVVKREGATCSVKKIS